MRTCYACRFALVVAIMIVLPGLSIGQTLSYDDLVNLQKSNLEKTKGFFTYKGWSWHMSEEDVEGAFSTDDYVLTCDRILWRNMSGEVQYLTQPGCANIIIYYTDESTFAKLENEARLRLKSVESASRHSALSSSYQGGGIQMDFSSFKDNDYSYSIYYSVSVFNLTDVQQRIRQLCDTCKGWGQVAEYEKCMTCRGKGSKICDACDASGELRCGSCRSGRVTCTQCRGNTYRCQKCYGEGKFMCRTCSGQKSIMCRKCHGQGTVLQHFLGQSITIVCTGCQGKGRNTCADCSGEGVLLCSNCDGVGTPECPTCHGEKSITCPSCNGDYSKPCPACRGRGHTDIVCTSCEGKGTSRDYVRKVCPVCHGLKLKQN